MLCRNPEATGGARGRILRYQPGLCRRLFSLPSAKTQSLRMDRASNPQKPAASSPRQHSRRCFRRLRPRTSSTPKSQIPSRTGSRHRQPSSGGFRQATATERSIKCSASLGCEGPAAPACRAVSAPVPRGCSATCVFSARDTTSTCRGPQAPPARSASPDAPPQSEPRTRDWIGRALTQDS